METVETITLTCDPTGTIGQIDHSILSTLAGMGGNENPLFRFFTTREAREFRKVSHEFLHFVTETQWDDVRPMVDRLRVFRDRSQVFNDCHHTTTVASPLHVNVRLWRESFPHAIGVRLRRCEPLTDEILMPLRGILHLDAEWEHPSTTYERQGRNYRCPSVDPRDESSITDDGFQHLQGIRWLNLRGRTLPYITDAGLPHLRGIEHLYLGYAWYVTPYSFLQLRGITTLSGCQYANPLLQCIKKGNYDAAIAMIDTVDQMWTHADEHQSVFHAACDIQNKELILALLKCGIRPAGFVYNKEIHQFIRDQGY